MNSSCSSPTCTSALKGTARQICPCQRGLLPQTNLCGTHFSHCTSGGLCSRSDGFTLEQGVLSEGHSHLDAQAEMNDFANPKWNFRYRGWVNLLDFREALREPKVPTGRVDLHGEGQFAGGRFKGSGSYSGQDITLPYTEFHAAGLTSRGSYQIDDRGLEVPDFSASAMGGSVTGRVTMRFDGLQFRADTHVQNVRL